MGKSLDENACVACPVLCERCTKESCLRCGDDFVLVDGACKEKDDMALLVSSNNTLKCAEPFFPDSGECRACPALCISCRDGSTCSVCASGTSLSQDGACASLKNATLQTHAGAVACDDSFVATGTTCESCADRFVSTCPSCTLCDGERCVQCDGDVVFDNGAWRSSPQCSRADGSVCQTCDDGSLRFNTTDCVPAGDCEAFVDGVCVSCRKGLVLLTDGTCVESGDCTAHNGGACLRCATGMHPDESGVCQRLSPRNLTRSVRRIVCHVRVQRAVLPFVRC